MEKFSEKQKAGWAEYINRFQDDTTGLFEPAVHFRDIERDNYQLTCFCLSALDILGRNTKVPLNFIQQWGRIEDVEQYLVKKGCLDGRGGSGNSAMFLAIFLTHQYEHSKAEHFLEKINLWFDLHDKSQNKSGFWGVRRSDQSLSGLQNAVHQFVIYFYWKRDDGRTGLLY